MNNEGQGVPVRVEPEKLLRGEYEAERMPGGVPYPRTEPDFTKNILNEHELLYRPVVDEDYLEKGGQKPSWPSGKTFAVCITHDVDHVSENSFIQSVRKRKAHIRWNASVSAKVKQALLAGKDLLKWTKNIYSKDPQYRYEEWLAVEEKLGAKSTFFFWPGRKSVTRPHVTDCPYEMDDKVVFGGRRCSIAAMMREMDRRGWEIGLHSSWYSFDDVSEMKRQKESIEEVLGHGITSVRQHFLHYDIKITPRVQEEAGFKYDSTLGFNDNIGFRFGTSYPWNLYDLQAERPLQIMEVPLMVQEGALLDKNKVLRFDEDTAFQYISRITEQVKKTQGVLVLLWHPHSIAKEEWFGLYLKTMDYLKDNDPWFAPVRDIGQYWEQTAGHREHK